jgi:peroxiredoxin
MSQAEIAGGRVSPKGEIPRTGYRLRDFLLKSTTGPEVRLSDYRGRSNLILIFVDPAEPLAPIRDLAAQYSRIREEQTEVLLIVPAARLGEPEASIQLPFPLLVDRNRQVHAEYGLERKADSIPAIFIADRFGELVASYVGSEIANATSASILKWLQFMNSRCPECEPPEWPLEE